MVAADMLVAHSCAATASSKPWIAKGDGTNGSPQVSFKTACTNRRTSDEDATLESIYTSSNHNFPIS